MARWLNRCRFATQAEGRVAVFKFIEGWYKTHRQSRGSSRGVTRPTATGGATPSPRMLLPPQRGAYAATPACLSESQPWSQVISRFESEDIGDATAQLEATE